jgi:3-hydroxyisobutyrate dehydrogenase-like beta-hydroxyacid dehydrogenase
MHVSVKLILIFFINLTIIKFGENNMKIGFIGLGLMGLRMANNLLQKGEEIIVYNRTKDKADILVKNGATLAESPAEVGANSKVLFTMLSDPEAVDKIAFGENGFIYHMEQKSIWVDCSTVNPSFSLDCLRKASSMNIKFIDAPVAGTTKPAEKGELSFFVGGSEEDFNQIKPLLEKMGNKIFYMGTNGKGTSIKMVINLILGQTMVAFSEGMVLGESLGFSKQRLFEMLIGGPVTAPFISGKKDKLLNDNFEAEFPLQWMHKDFELACRTGYEQKVALPSANSVKEIFALAQRFGFGEADFSAVYKFLRGEKN